MKICACLITLTFLAMSATAATATDPTPSLATILQQVIARDEANQKALQSMEFDNAATIEQLDANQHVTKRQDVKMIIRPGAPDEITVLSVHGDDLPSDPDEAARKAKGDESKRKNLRFALKDMAQRFVITLAGTDVYRGQSVYLLAFEPKPDQTYKNQTEKVLNHLHGKMWISTKDYSVLQTDATLAQPVEVAWFLAEISTLDFHYELQNTSGGMGPAAVRTLVVVEALFITIRQRMTVDMTHFRPRSNAIAQSK
jgi:hypothetical protein